MADPFEDPAGSGSSEDISAPQQVALNASAVLAVDRNATLTLGTDALIVLDEGLKHRRAATNCCGLLPQFSKTTVAIPFYNILWAELQDFEIIIKYARSTGKKRCRVGYVNYTVTDKALHDHARWWVEKLMQKAYPPSTKRRKRIKVLVNPFGGQGYAQKLWTREVEPLFAAANCEIEVERTAYRGHAVEIVQKLNIDDFDVIASASGDGLPFEVWNGLAKQKQPRRALRKIAVVQIPCGSGNALSLNFNGTEAPSLAAVAIVKGVRTPMDLTAITQGDQKYYSFLSQATGIVAEIDLGTDSLRWMGPLRFTWGAIVRILNQSIYPAELSVVVDTEDKAAIKANWRRAHEEQKSAKLKTLPHEDHEEDLIDGNSDELPALRYGTVNDTLSSDFQTQDLPTLGNFYAGNLCVMSPDAPFFTTALPSDGRIDMINIDAMVPRLRALRMLAEVENGALMDFPEVSYRKVLAYRITPRYHQPPPKHRLRAKIGRWLGGGGKQKQGLVAIDGESVPFEPFQAEVVQGLGTVLSKYGAVYAFDGPNVS